MIRANKFGFEKPHPGITGRFGVDGGVAGAIIAAGFVVMGLIGMPEARPFLSWAVVLGILLGLILWFRHRNEEVSSQQASMLRLNDSNVDPQSRANDSQHLASGRASYVGRYGGLTVPGTRAGLVVSIGLVLLAWAAIPVARPFIVGTAVLGGLLGLILWWKHNRSDS